MRCFLLFIAVSGIAQPLWFEPNQGQVHRSVEFLARSSGGYVYFGPNRMAVRDVRMELVGGNRKASAEFAEPTDGISSYFIGRTENDWHTGIPHYARVRYRNVYSGIDLVYYGRGRDLEYDFVLRPGADPKQIRVAYNKRVRVDENGDLLIAGLRQRRPKVYQDGREIACQYLVGKRNEVRLALAEYDQSQSLTVDPVLEFSTYLGGVAQELAHGVAIDIQGFVYLAGASQAPAQGSLDPFQQTTNIVNSPVVFKMTPDGRKIVYYVFVGNNSWDQATGVAVDNSGSAVITGLTRNANFPLKNAFQTQFKAIFDNAFVTRLSADGKSLVYSSYIGGSNSETASGVALDSQQNAIITGYTFSNDFPVKQAFQSRNAGMADCYAAKVGPSGDLLWSTYLGGASADWCYSIATDVQSNSYIAAGSQSLDFPLKNAMQTILTPRQGHPTPLLIKLNADGNVLDATFLGGPLAGTITGVALDVAGNVYVAGVADEKLATTSAFQDQATNPWNVFFIAMDKGLQRTNVATYVGGSTGLYDVKLALDTAGSIYLTGTTSSPDFPAKDSFQPFAGGGFYQCDAFVTKFARDGRSLVYSTFLGGHNLENAGGIAVDGPGNAFVVGRTLSDDFPTKQAFQGTYGGGGDFFFVKISDNNPLAPSPLTPTPGHLVFRYTQGGAMPASQTVAISGPTFSAAASAPWIAATASSTNVVVSVNTAGLVPGTYDSNVVLTPQTGPAASIEVALTVLAPAPVLISVDPALITSGSNDTIITLHGSGFSSASTVQVDGVPWTLGAVQFVDASTLRFSMSAGFLTVRYNHTITVQNPQSASSNILSLTVGDPAPQFAAESVVNAASYAAGAVAPGEIVTVFGSNFGTQSNTQVVFSDVPATVVYVTTTQLAAAVPYSVAGAQRTAMVVTSNGVSSTPVSLNVTDAVPAIFTADASGKGQGAALNQDNTVNGPFNPASVGSVVALYGTGGGTLSGDALPRLALPVTATVGGLPATVYYAGAAPGLVQGAMQINVQIPTGVTAGPSVPVVLTIGDKSSPPVTIAVQ